MSSPPFPASRCRRPQTDLPDGPELTGKTVIVLGYENDAYLKITQDGVWQNIRSPTVYLNADVVGEMPDDVSADAPPNWQLISNSSGCALPRPPHPLRGGMGCLPRSEAMLVSPT